MSKHKRRRKHRLHIRRRTKPGAPPGVLVDDPTARPSTMEVIAYGPTEIHERARATLDDVSHLRGRFPILWINVNGLRDTTLIDGLGARLGLHRLALEDVVNTHQRPKVDVFEDALFVVARMADLHHRAVTEQLSLFVGRDFVVTFQEEPGDCWQSLRERLRHQAGRLRNSGPDYLAYALLDSVIDAYFPVLEHLGERIEVLEDRVVEDASRRSLDELHAVKGELVLLRRAIWPHREALASLARDPSPLISETTRLYLRDCYDHVIQLADLVETYRELTADLRDLYMSAVSNRINETMRVLTIIATIFIPITFIASIYGMNFDHSAGAWNMPELHWKWGYPVALGLMMFVTLAMLVYFWRRGWMTADMFGLESRAPESGDGTDENGGASS